MKTYRMPEAPGPVADLVPESADGNALTPTTPVLCINRGRTTLKDKFDGRDYLIPPGYVTMSYGAALHHQERLIVPGSRNPEIGTQQSFIGIIGVDDADLCVPLTDEECVRAGQAVEAIDRGAMSDPADRAVKALKAGSGQPNRRGAAGGIRPQIDTSVQVSDAAREAAEHIFDKPETSATREDEAALEPELVGAGGGRGRRR